jgi:hypothetical protein
MWKFLFTAWQVVNVCWKYIGPIYFDLVKIIKDIKEKGLEDEVARKTVFQEVTDFIQARGAKKVPDCVLNTSIELTYLIIKWQQGKITAEE